ncbi:hypothetical protein V9T40_006785 [Parthenolecanium corni]|uniref:Uncharacterized protein n=1 Tax=Parthenolecanium corni TaxID=536013 RepID=A0AAN9Y8B4_9HEMI
MGKKAYPNVPSNDSSLITGLCRSHEWRRPPPTTKGLHIAHTWWANWGLDWSAIDAIIRLIERPARV